MFASSLEPTDAQDDSNMYTLNQPQSLVLCVDLRVLLLVCLQTKPFDQQALNYIPTSCPRAKFLFLSNFSKFSPYI